MQNNQGEEMIRSYATYYLHPISAGSSARRAMNYNSNNSLTLTNQRPWRRGAVEEQPPSSSPERLSQWPRPTYRWPEEDLYSPWRLFEERVRTGPFGLSRFPSQPHSPVRILVLGDDSQALVNPRLTQFIRDSPPRIRGEWNLVPTGSAPEPAEDPGLAEAEFKKAMSKLRKQVYNPPYPRRRAWRRGLFSSRSSNGQSAAEEEEEKDEGKECTVCLEAFVANEHVLITPCNHMFHNDCLVPWVKLHGKCPVCRFVFCEKKPAVSRNNSSNNSFNGVVLTHGFSNRREMMHDDVSLDIATLIRAMDEAFDWMTYSRPAPYQ